LQKITEKFQPLYDTTVFKLDKARVFVVLYPFYTNGRSVFIRNYLRISFHVVVTPALYAEDPIFTSRPCIQLYLLRCFL